MRGSLGPAKRAALNVMGREVSDMVDVLVFFWGYVDVCFGKGEVTRLRKEMAEGEDERLIDRKG